MGWGLGWGIDSGLLGWPLQMWMHHLTHSGNGNQGQSILGGTEPSAQSPAHCPISGAWGRKEPHLLATVAQNTVPQQVAGDEMRKAGSCLLEIQPSGWELG